MQAATSNAAQVSTVAADRIREVENEANAYIVGERTKAEERVTTVTQHAHEVIAAERARSYEVQLTASQRIAALESELQLVHTV